MSFHRLPSRRSRFALAAVAVVGLAALPFALGRTTHFYIQHNLVTDDQSINAADFTDPNLVNAWGLTASPSGPWWVADNHNSVATIYDGNGNPAPLVVGIPGGGGAAGAPTGAVFNPTSDFVVHDGGMNSGPAVFLFAGEDGAITGWNPDVPPPPPSTQAMVAVDNSSSGAVYKGLALAQTSTGNFLFATDFHNNKIDVFDGSFNPVTSKFGFTDPSLPAGYAPFGIAFLKNHLYVTFALQDSAAHDNVDGEHLGYVDVFETDGFLLKRLISAGSLNAPWGLALAPSDFGGFGNDLLVGNFGDGRIFAYDATTGRSRGPLKDGSGKAIHIDGLWGLGFGNGTSSGPTNTLYFTAGPVMENHGLFGRIDAN